MQITHHKVFYCKNCEEVEIDYPNYPPIDMCEECNINMEEIGWIDCNDCPAKDGVHK
jgi:hypothetical protein